MVKKKDRERQRKQRQWEAEKAETESRWRIAPQMKSDLKAKGCVLPFYDFLDSYEEEFNKVAAWAKKEHPSLYGVYEVPAADLDDEDVQKRLNLPSEWQKIVFRCDDELAESYHVRDGGANIRGATTAFRDASGSLQTVIEVLKNPSCSFQHKEHKYVFKLPALLHEIGHVSDHERKINFDPDAKTANLIEGEVYAHLFALNECFRRAYYQSGQMYLDAISKYKDATDYRGEVMRRVLARFQKPEFKEWMEYDLETK